MAEQEKSDVKRPVVAMVLGVLVLAGAGILALLTLEGTAPQTPDAAPSSPARAAGSGCVSPTCQQGSGKTEGDSFGPGL